MHLLALLTALLLFHSSHANKTASWLKKRAQLIGSVYGKGDGVLPSRAVPDQVLRYDRDPGIRGLVWNISNGLFPITSTVFYAPASGDPSKRSTKVLQLAMVVVVAVVVVVLLLLLVVVLLLLGLLLLRLLLFLTLDLRQAFMFHHGHSDCVCAPPKGANSSCHHLVWMACHPGCNSSMPSQAEKTMPGYSWWDL